MLERISQDKFYQSQKGYFAGELHNAMLDHKDIWLLTGDLGYKMFDFIIKDFPDRFINTGASEQALIGVAIGLALEGKLPFVYSIPNFLIYRPYEWIRNYVDNEEVPVQLVGGGRDREYEEDGYTHQSEDMRQVLRNFPNISQYWPDDKGEVPDIIREMVKNRRPTYLSLRRKL